MYFKPLVFILFWSLFYFEYTWFLIYSSKLWYGRDDYCSISIKELDVSELNIIELWIEYCKICAFSRLYLLLSRKKIGFLGLILYVVILVIGLPYKLVKLFYFIFKCKGDLRDSLDQLYFRVYYTYRYNKIEVLEGRIYLNCYSLLKLLIKSDVRHLSKKCQFEYLDVLRKKCYEISLLDRQRSSNVKFEMSKLILKENIEISQPHYTYLEKRGEGNYTIHPTSNLPSLENSQKATLAMPSAVKHGSKLPATVLSFDVVGIEKINKVKVIPSQEMEDVLYDVVDIYGLPMSRCEYTRDKDIQFHEIIFNHTKHCEKFIIELKKELRCGYYNYSLLNASDLDILKAVAEYNGMEWE